MSVFFWGGTQHSLSWNGSEGHPALRCLSQFSPFTAVFLWNLRGQSFLWYCIQGLRRRTLPPCIQHLDLTRYCFFLPLVLWDSRASWLRCGCLDVHSSGKSLSFQLSPECQFTVSGCFSFLPLLHSTFNKGWKSDSWGMGLWRIKFVLFCLILGSKGTEANREKSVVPNPLCVYVGVFFLDKISGI